MSDDHTEHAQEEIHEHAHHAKEKWIGWAALCAAVFAALAAIGGSASSTHLTQSNRQQIDANDTWSLYQAKSIKQSILASKDELLAAGGKEIPAKDGEKMKQYETELVELKPQAEGFQKLSHEHLETAETLELAVTLFHVSIAVVAVSVLTKRKSFWFASLVSATIGIHFLSMGFLHAPTDAPEAGEAPSSQHAPAPAAEHH